MGRSNVVDEGSLVDLAELRLPILAGKHAKLPVVGSRESAKVIEPALHRNFGDCFSAAELNSVGLVDDAMAILDKARREFPEDAEIQSLWRMLKR